jgi:hypothetical protein
MRILGIDPGTATTGFGVIDTASAENFTLIDFGLISTSKELPHGQRLHLIYSGMVEISSGRNFGRASFFCHQCPNGNFRGPGYWSYQIGDLSIRPSQL